MSTTERDALRDQRAAIAAREHYQTAAERLTRLARELYTGDWTEWADEAARMAARAYRAARAERPARGGVK